MCSIFLCTLRTGYINFVLFLRMYLCLISKHSKKWHIMSVLKWRCVCIRRSKVRMVMDTWLVKKCIDVLLTLNANKITANQIQSFNNTSTKPHFWILSIVQSIHIFINFYSKINIIAVHPPTVPPWSFHNNCFDFPNNGFSILSQHAGSMFVLTFWRIVLSPSLRGALNLIGVDAAW